MTIQLGQIAPDFEQESTEGQFSFHDWLGRSWGVLFSHPKDYTPVCTTELAEVARLKPEWQRRNVKPIGLSVDPADSHKGWERDIEETQGQALNFPVLGDAGPRSPISTAWSTPTPIRPSPFARCSSSIRTRRCG